MRPTGHTDEDLNTQDLAGAGLRPPRMGRHTLLPAPLGFGLGLAWLALGVAAAFLTAHEFTLFFIVAGLACIVASFFPRALLKKLEKPRDFLRGSLRLGNPGAFFGGLALLALGLCLDILGIEPTDVPPLFIATVGGLTVILGFVPPDYKYKRIPNVPVLLGGVGCLGWGFYLFAVGPTESGWALMAVGVVLCAAGFVPERGAVSRERQDRAPAGAGTADEATRRDDGGS